MTATVETKRILLVDSASHTTTVLADRLRMQGYAVDVAHDPAEGARMALEDPPSAVIADLWMPSISGVQLCRLLNAEAGTEHVPVILRGPDGARNRFWADRAGAKAYVVKGRMGDLVIALANAIAAAPPADPFFTTLATGADVRDRIAGHLDAALFESVLASEIRALGTCGEFDRLFDLFSQFVARVTSYRWLAISTQLPARLGVHCNPARREACEAEARAALGVGPSVVGLVVEDEDAFEDTGGPPPIVQPIELGGICLGKLALAPRAPANDKDAAFVAVVAREIAGPVRIATLVEESQRLARVDALTGLLNRRAFGESLDIELERSRRYGHALSVLMLDVDHFKVINDRRGHGSGDAVLARLGVIMHETLRRPDIPARWGGEEFVIALPDTPLAGARDAAERLRAAIQGMPVNDAAGAPIPVTASIGVAQFRDGDTFDALVDRADRAMYLAKSSGRNRVVVADAPTESEVRASAE